VPAFFDHIHPGNRHRPNETLVCSASRNKQSERCGGNQRERIHRPNGVVIVVIGILKLCPGVLFVRGRNRVEMRMHGRRMIVIRPWMNMLKWRHKECQQ